MMIEYKVKVHDNGTKIEWFLNGMLHCEHGPALILNDGRSYYYLNGLFLDKTQWEERLSPTKEMTIEEIQKELGYKIKIVE